MCAVDIIQSASTQIFAHRSMKPAPDNGSISQAVHLWPLALGAAINTSTARDLAELEPELLGSMKDTTDNTHDGVVVGCWSPTFDGRACVRVDKLVDCSVQYSHCGLQYRQRCSGTTDACSHVAASSSGMHSMPGPCQRIVHARVELSRSCHRSYP